ncbi:tyrosine-protein phosphatase non-receptor type 9-like isoform X1 [Sinocyclocheilus anshuiensis]|uniref:tyrosine-protein phosphatase non-receptor type 9-like isoform X1 n=2 Tax=Sinocyclocheilus anshuiensis TaxID=1608454 RepID=UPI0007B8E6B3|nr:PREDICTED: tyrosine-protein phosphatase non-receptor type 9-like isoform X1 [Sinocyclocheilus anshuiensis]
MAEALTTQEEVAVEEFLAEVRCREQSQNADLVSQMTAVKFLMARKFDVSRAIDLFQAYKNTRIKEGIYNINPNEEPLRSELLSGKFTVLPGRDAKGAALALFTARLHRPDLTTHKAVLQAIIYQLDKAIESVQTQRDGLIFIYDMTNSTYANFDYELCVKILNLLKGAFPARLKCVFIVSSPLWFRAPFAVLRLFVREKLRERVCTVKAHELVNHIPVSSLPEHLGGSSQYSHIAWIQSCVNSSPNHPNNSPYVTGDCLGSLLHSYSMEHGQNTSADPLTANTSGATLLGDGLNSNCPILDDGNANLQNHRTAGHAHWNGSVLPGSGGISGSNANFVNGRGRQPPPQSDTPPDTPLHQKHTAGAIVPGGGGTMGTEGACLDDRRQDGNGAEDIQQDVEFLEEEVDEGDGIPPLPLKSRLPPLHHSPAPDMSWLPGTTTETAALSVHAAEPGGMSVQDLVQHVKCKKKKGIYQEYEEIRKEPPAGTFDYSKKASNQIKNRYSDVLCLDQSRVRLCPLNNEDDETSDYINASFMDGYKRSNAYIATQGPLPKTFGDFWRMVWEQMVLIIVMTTRVVERGRVKCGQYWPLEAGRTEDYGYFLVRNVHIEMFQDFKLSHLELFNTQTGECRELSHYLYMSWPDFGVPKSASAMLDFQAHVKQRQESSLRTLYPDWTGPPGGPPVVVHCSAGIGRTGTFCTLDICLSRLEDIGTVNIKQSVRRMRTQRAFSIQTWDQYYFCYKAVIEYAQQTGLLQPVEWSDTELETDSE